MSGQSSASILQGLRAKIRRIEGHGADFGGETVRFGDRELDQVLPWHGLPRRSLHEINGRAAGGFAMALASRALSAAGDHARGVVLWCAQDRLRCLEGEIYGPGLKPFGIAAERFVWVRARSPQESLWVAEEALRSSAVCCAVAELPPLDLLTSRRLQLAAEEGGGLGLALLRDSRGHTIPDLAPNAAVTRWRAEPGRSGQGTFWQLDLWRCRGGTPRRWEVRWNEPTLSFALVAEVGDRTVDAGSAACRHAAFA